MSLKHSGWAPKGVMAPEKSQQCLPHEPAHALRSQFAGTPLARSIRNVQVSGAVSPRCRRLRCLMQDPPKGVLGPQFRMSRKSSRILGDLIKKHLSLFVFLLILLSPQHSLCHRLWLGIVTWEQIVILICNLLDVA